MTFYLFHSVKKVWDDLALIVCQFVFSRHLVFPTCVLLSPMLKLPRWVYLIPFIVLSLDGVFRGCFARVFPFLLVLLLFIRFISFASSESLVSAHPSFFAFSLLLFLVSVFQQAF